MDWQTLGLASGATLVGIAGLQALTAGIAARKRTRVSQASCIARQQKFDRQLATELQWARAAKPTFKAWPGTRSFLVADIVDEAVDCKSFYLVPTDGHPLPRFEPGQFLTFNLLLDPRLKPLVRCYSLSDRPHEDYYRITVKYARPPRGGTSLPDGLGSSYLHHRVQTGSILEVQAPQGAFFLDPTEDTPVVFIGCGIGITPILSMANTIAYEHRDQQAYVFAGFGNRSEHPFRQAMQQLNSACDNLHFDICYSRPMPADQVGRDYDHRGYVDLARLKQILPSNNFRYYLCGPAAMMQSLVPSLLAWGVPESHIHVEAFGPATVKGLLRTRATEHVASGPCEVDFTLANTSLTWNGEHESLLEFAESQGVPLDYGCRAGNCGQCLVSVKRGTFKHVKDPGLPLGSDQCLTCIGVPCGDLVLEA